MLQNSAVRTSAASAATTARTLGSVREPIRPRPLTAVHATRTSAKQDSCRSTSRARSRSAVVPAASSLLGAGGGRCLVPDNGAHVRCRLDHPELLHVINLKFQDFRVDQGAEDRDEALG